MPLHRSPLRALEGFQGNNCASPRVFGAKGDGTTDDRAAIQTTIDYLKTLPGGGTLMIDGMYRVTDTLEMDSRVSVEGVGSAVTSNATSAIYIDHATHSMFNWGAVSSGFGYTNQRISNVLLGAKQANNARVFSQDSSHPLHLLVDNVTYNEGPSFGLLGGGLWSSTSNSCVVFNNCEFSQLPTAPQLVVGNNINDSFTFRNCRFQNPSGANSRLIDMQSGNLFVTGCDFLGGTSPAGGAAGIHTGALANTRAVGNTFRVDLGADVFPAFTWAAGGRLVESGNIYVFDAFGTPTFFGPSMFTLTGVVPKLAEGSRITPRANYHRGDGNSTVTLDDYVEHVNFEALSASTVTFTLPRIFMPGQRFRLTVKNSTGGALTVVFTPYNQVGGTNPNIAAGKYATYEFIASDIVTLATYSWYFISSGYSP
jgi:Pectate lyase superfamily protein